MCLYMCIKKLRMNSQLTPQSTVVNSILLHWHEPFLLVPYSTIISHYLLACSQIMRDNGMVWYKQEHFMPIEFAKLT